MEFLKSNAKREALFVVLYMALGIFFVVRPGTTFRVIGNVIAILMLIIGIIHICLYFTKKNFEGIQKNGLVTGIILSIVSIYLLLKPEFLESLVGFIIGFMILLAGVTQLQNAVDLFYFKNKAWPFMLVTAAILIILGIIALVNPFSATETFVEATGVFVIISAIFKLISILILYIGAKSVDKALDEAAKEAGAVDVTETSVVEDEPEKAETKDEDSEKKEAVFNEDI